MKHLPSGGTVGVLLAAVVPFIVSGSAFAEVSLEEIGKNPDLWPDQVTITEGVSFGPGWDFNAGMKVDLCAVMNGEAVFIHRNEVFRLEPEFTDLVARAGKIAEGGVPTASGKPRLVDYLVKNGKTVSSGNLAPVSDDAIPSGALYVVYYGNGGCGWCKSARPFMDAMLEMIENHSPGKIQLVHANSDTNSAAMRRYAMTLGAGWIVTEPQDKWLTQNILIQGKMGDFINFPTVALYTETGRLIARGSRDEREGMKPVADVLMKLDQMLVAGSDPAGAVAMRE
ncbi:MAG: hypothetical protein R3F07_16555 [Opitutaceae bacterium]